MKILISNLILCFFLSAGSSFATAAGGNCDTIDQAPAKIRAKLEKMCAGRLERKEKSEQKGKKLANWSKAFFDGGKKRGAVFTIYKNHNTWLWPCKDYATDCDIQDLQLTKGIGNEIYKQGDNVVFLFKDATEGNPVITCHRYVVDGAGEKMISRDSKICGTR